MINLKSVDVGDFSGGITDNFIDGPGNKSEKLDNLYIDKNKKLILRPGSDVIGANTFQIPTGSERVNALIVHDSTLFHTALTQVSYTNGTTSNLNLTGPSGNTAFDIGPETAKTSFAIWNHHLIVTNDSFPKIPKIYKDTGGVWRLVTAGLPALATSPTVTAGASGSNSYQYAFYYFREYTVGSVTFADSGTTTIVPLTSASAPNTNTVAITAIPVVSNGSTGNYDTANIKVEIYRTINNGTVFYFVGEITNGTTTYSDSTSDTVLQTNPILYTTGGVVDNDEPPKAKYVHVVNDVCWYGHVSEDGEVATNKYRQSLKFDPDSCPADFFDELEDEITGLSSVQGVLIVGCKNSIYRVDGFFDELGKGGMSHTRISDSVGVVSNNSFVQAQGLLFFAGTDGFYYTDGYNVTKLTRDLNVTYKTLIQADQQKKNIYGTLDKINNLIWWAVESNTSNLDNDSVYVLDLNWPLESASFTTLSGGLSFRPTSLCYFNNQILRGDTRGYILYHDPLLRTDPKIDESSVPTLWATQAIMYDYRSQVSSLGSPSMRKWVPWITVEIFNDSNLSLQIISDNDRGKFVSNLSELKYLGNFVWGDPLIVWGNSTCVWGKTEIIEEKKRFPAGSMRCNYKQIRMQNSYTIVQRSDDYGQATVDGTGNTATLVNTTDYDWDAGSVDYYIYFSNDSYATGYLITDRAADVITFRDIGGIAPTGTYKWEIKGYKKGEFFHLISYSIFYAPLSMSQKPGSVSESNANA